MSDILNFLPYTVWDSKLPLDTVLANNTKDCSESGKNFTLNNLDYYSHLLKAVLDLGYCDIRPMYRFMEPMDEDKVVIGLRHDVDHDIVTARAMSRIEYDVNLSGSYYLLHSHPFVTPSYYAQYDLQKHILLRNNCLASIYREMQQNGSEIGLHVDAVRLYQHGFDGQQAIAEELSWLRSIGLTITGIAAHGSAPADGVENFEFFHEFHLGHRQHIIISGRCIPLGALSASALGIMYEANFAHVPQKKPSLMEIEEWIKEATTPDVKKFLHLYLYKNMYMTSASDAICWLYAQDCWAISSPEGFLPQGNFRDIIGLCTRSRGKRIVFHIHPFYCGLRENSHA